MSDAVQSYFTYHQTMSTYPDDAYNVVLFGETGVGKSSVINLIAGEDIAETSSSLNGCTRQATGYPFTLSGDISLRIFDTVGLEKSETDVAGFIGDVERAQELIASLEKTGGVNLLLFCIEAGRFTISMQRSYHLLSGILCQNKVPLALVITHLENEADMEKWWRENEGTVKRLKINAVAHACITTITTHVTTKVDESRVALHKLFQNSLGDRNPPPYRRNIQNQLIALIDQPLLLLKNMKRRIEVRKKLEMYCTRIPRREAKRLAKLIVKG